MSGIFGILTEQEKDITPMLPWNRLYGGDGEDIFLQKEIALGCCMQSLSDSHVQENLIIHEGDKYAVIDAVIYNRDELLCRCECDYDISDAELLFALIEKDGKSALAGVNGDFAGAIYDEKNRKLTLFRDHMGIRPLFYYVDGDAIAFSSDLRGLLTCKNVKTAIKEDWIYRTVAGFDNETLDDTPYEHVSCVTPAHYIEISFGKKGCEIGIHRYWRLGSRKIRLSSKEEYAKRLRELTEDAVRRRLSAVSDIVGAELSGGLDSGVIDILINRFGREAVYFSWSYDPDELAFAENDERKVIFDICKQEHINCNFMHESMDFTDKLADEVKRAGIVQGPEESIDFRFKFPTTANTYNLMHGAFLVREKGSKIMFTGHGGDEGVSHRSSVYAMFFHHEYYHYLRHFWPSTSGKLRALKTLRKAARFVVRSQRANREVYKNWYASPELLKKSFLNAQHDVNEYHLQFGYDPVAYIESGGSRNRLDNIALFGACSGVRYLVPYFDYRLIDFAVSIPRHLFIKGNVKRYIFREAFRDIMPKSLYEVDTKEDMSFRNVETPEDWFKEHDRRKKEIIDKLDHDYWAKYLDFDAIDELYNSGKPDDDEFARENRWMKALLMLALAQNTLRA